MFTEAQNFSIVQTELDKVFFQKFDYNETFPGVAHATTAEIFALTRDNSRCVDSIS